MHVQKRVDQVEFWLRELHIVESSNLLEYSPDGYLARSVFNYLDQTVVLRISAFQVFMSQFFER